MADQGNGRADAPGGEGTYVGEIDENGNWVPAPGSGDNGDSGGPEAPGSKAPGQIGDYVGSGVSQWAFNALGVPVFGLGALAYAYAFGDDKEAAEQGKDFLATESLEALAGKAGWESGPSGIGLYIMSQMQDDCGGCTQNPFWSITGGDPNVPVPVELLPEVPPPAEPSVDEGTYLGEIDDPPIDDAGAPPGGAPDAENGGEGTYVGEIDENGNWVPAPGGEGTYVAPTDVPLLEFAIPGSAADAADAPPEEYPGLGDVDMVSYVDYEGTYVGGIDENGNWVPGSGDSGPDDTGPDDTGPDDTGPDDTGPDDTGPDDTGPDDTGPDDTGPDDTGPDDTGPDDTGPDDTGPDDTGPDDTGPDDSGAAGGDEGIPAVANDEGIPAVADGEGIPAVADGEGIPAVADGDAGVGGGGAGVDAGDLEGRRARGGASARRVLAEAAPASASRRLTPILAAGNQPRPGGLVKRARATQHFGRAAKPAPVNPADNLTG